MSTDSLQEKYPNISSYIYTFNNPIKFIDPIGLSGEEPPILNIYVFDQPNRPKDKGVKGTSYTAKIYITDTENNVIGSYRVSSYPNSRSNNDNTTKFNIIVEGEHSYNNKYGHKSGTQRGLNIDDSNDNSRTAQGYNSMKDEITMKYVNVHSGASDNGNFSSRGSAACITLHPDDYNGFMDNFVWSGKSCKTGLSEGKIYIYRNKNLLNQVEARENNSTYNPFKNIYIRNDKISKYEKNLFDTLPF